MRVRVGGGGVRRFFVGEDACDTKIIAIFAKVFMYIAVLRLYSEL